MNPSLTPYLCEGPVAKAIRERRTIRQFNEQPVPASLLTALLNVAVWAPTHGNRQPWRFKMYIGEGRHAFARAVVHTFRTREQLNHSAAKLAYYTETPAHLIIIMSEDTRKKQREEDFAAVSSLIQNFQLAAWEQGLGVVWKTNNFLHDEQFRQFADISDQESIAAILHIGYPRTYPAPQAREKAEDRLTIISSDTYQQEEVD